MREPNFIELQEISLIVRSYLYGYYHAKQIVITDKPTRHTFARTRIKALLEENEEFGMQDVVISNELIEKIINETMKEEWNL